MYQAKHLPLLILAELPCVGDRACFSTWSKLLVVSWDSAIVSAAWFLLYRSRLLRVCQDLVAFQREGSQSAPSCRLIQSRPLGWGFFFFYFYCYSVTVVLGQYIQFSGATVCKPCWTTHQAIWGCPMTISKTGAPGKYRSPFLEGPGELYHNDGISQPKFSERTFGASKCGASLNPAPQAVAPGQVNGHFPPLPLWGGICYIIFYPHDFIVT